MKRYILFARLDYYSSERLDDEVLTFSLQSELDDFLRARQTDPQFLRYDCYLISDTENGDKYKLNDIEELSDWRVTE